MTRACMNQILQRSPPALASPLIHSPGGYTDPEDSPAPPASLRGTPYPSPHCLALARGWDRPPRSPPLLSVLPTKPPCTSLSLIFAESPDEPATPPVHHCHLSTPNPCRPRHSGHDPILHPTHISGRFQPCIRAQHSPTTPLAQPLSFSRPLDPLARR
jgi:hypothetical protein